MHNTPLKPLVKIEGDQSPKTLEQQNVPSISPLITGQLVNTYNKLESVEAKREFEKRVDGALELAYGNQTLMGFHYMTLISRLYQNL